MEQIGLIQAFTDDLVIKGFSADTVRQYPRYIRALYEFTNGDLLNIDMETLKRYLVEMRKKKLSQTSIKRYFSAMSTFFNFLEMNGYPMKSNPLTPAFKRAYLKKSKNHTPERRQCPTVEQVKDLVSKILDPKEKAVVVLLFKTGIRCKELNELNITDLNLPNLTLHINPTAKRSNTTVYFDPETARVLGKWIQRRGNLNKKNSPALFLDRDGNRLSRQAIEALFTKHAEVAGLHNPSSPRLEDRLTCHCCRHWFSTQLLQKGMLREHVQELRGDSSRESIDIYNHIDPEELKQEYLVRIPQLECNL